MSWIKLNSGIKFDFADPKAEMITLHDIAHNLSKEQRFANCLDRDWSVLHHSLLVWKLAELNGESIERQYQALHHDAPEAYMKDIPTPLKRLLGDYNRIYAKVAVAIEKKLSVALHPLHSNIKQYDKTAMLIEDVRFSTKESHWHNFNENSIKNLSEKLDKDIGREVHKFYILRQWQVYQKYLRVHEHLAEKLNIKVEEDDYTTLQM